jgi:hypothetical protein
MSFRFRPSIEALELRDNPSGPDLLGPTGVPIDPTTGLPIPVTTTTTTDTTATTTGTGTPATTPVPTVPSQLLPPKS